MCIINFTDIPTNGPQDIPNLLTKYNKMFDSGLGLWNTNHYTWTKGRSYSLPYLSPSQYLGYIWMPSKGKLID